MIDFNLLKKKDWEIDLLPLPELMDETGESGRTYKTPQGNVYESVTTFLKRVLDNTAIDRWKARIGPEKAQQIMKHSTNRGSIVHGHLEDFLLGRDIGSSDYHLMFNSFKTHLRMNLTKIFAIENCLYSDILKIAGRVDCIGEWKKQLSIIDFKTSAKEKKEEYILSYYLQTAIYSFMLEERTGLKAQKLVILIGNEKNNKVQIFEKDRDEYIDILKDIIMNDRK